MNWTDQEYIDLVKVVKKENPTTVKDYKVAVGKLAKRGPFRYLVGQCMKMSEGLADPYRVEKALRKVLGP